MISNLHCKYLCNNLRRKATMEKRKTPSDNYICTCDIIASDTLSSIVWTEPVVFHAMWEARHQNAVTCQFAHVTRAKFPHLCCNAVLFHQRFLKISQKRTESRQQFQVVMVLKFYYTAQCAHHDVFALTFVKWNCNGSSVLSEMHKPRARYSGNGFRW